MSKTPNFPVLQDTADGDGKPWHLVAENDPVASRNMGGVAIAKNASNQFRVPAVDTQDRLIVNSEADDIVDLKGEGDNAGSGTFVTLFDITLQASMDYKNLEWVASCFRDATFEIVHIADLGGLSFLVLWQDNQLSEQSTTLALGSHQSIIFQRNMHNSSVIGIHRADGGWLARKFDLFSQT